MYKVVFECDVTGIGNVRHYETYIFVDADTAKSAKDKASDYIQTAYSDTFAILEVAPVFVLK